jgi:hypothetical protein
MQTLQIVSFLYCIEGHCPKEHLETDIERPVRRHLIARWDNDHRGNILKRFLVVGCRGIVQPSGRGVMVSALELSSRALLCKRLADQDPANRVFWIAEAEHWAQLSEEEASHRNNLLKSLVVLAALVRQKLVMLRAAGTARRTCR